MNTVAEAVEALGGPTAVSRYCSVGASAVVNWVAAGKFPPGRFPQLEQLAKSKGLDMPRELFAWSGDAAAD